MQIPYARVPFSSLMKTSRPGPRTSLPHVELAGRRAALVASDEDNAAVLRGRQVSLRNGIELHSVLDPDAGDVQKVSEIVPATEAA